MSRQFKVVIRGMLYLGPRIQKYDNSAYTTSNNLTHNPNISQLCSKCMTNDWVVLGRDECWPHTSSLTLITALSLALMTAIIYLFNPLVTSLYHWLIQSHSLTYHSSAPPYIHTFFFRAVRMPNHNHHSFFRGTRVSIYSKRAIITP